MNTILKRVIAMMLCFVLVAGFLPAGAFATENGETGASGATEVTTEPTQAASEDTEASAEVTESDVIAVTGITLDVTALEVGVGELPVTLTATVLPEDATDATVTWTSSEPGVASVDENGVVTFGYMGEAVITAAAGEFTAECAVTVGEGEWAEYAANAVVIAGSDYQQSGTAPKTNATNILNAIKKDYATANGFIFGGDYSQTTSNSASTTSGINELKGVVQDIYGTGLNEIYVQGNHDAAVGELTATGAHDTDAYGVFSINEDDFSSGGHYSSSVASDSMLTALESYLNAKVAENYTKPIFVATHLPLHATSRGDNTSASEIFNLLNAAGANGLNIIFLFGHNHSQGYDAYLGNGSIYLKKGDSITVAGGTTSTLNFTYMNYGYVGYVSGSADTTLTMTAFEISDTEVAVKRYDANGLHNLKAEGTTVSGYNTDKNVYGTAVIDLSDGTSTISAIGSDSGDDNTGKDSTVTPEGGDWTTISDGSGKVIYKLDTDGVDAGSKYLIVSDDEAVAMSAAANSNNSVAIEFNSDETEAYIDSTSYEWTIATSSTGYKMYNAAGNYIGRSSSSISNDSSDVWTIDGNGEGAYTVKTGNYVLRYSGSNSAFRLGSSYSYSNAVRLYKYDRTDTGEAEYAMLNGALTYTVARGADAKAALDAVKAGINVLTSASADGSNPTTLDDGNTDITWTLASDYSGAVPGEYAVTISYKGVQLGVAKVIVPEATIVGYDCDETGAVNKGASKNAETGAYITVDVKDDEGEDYQVPVTVEMLTDAEGNKVSTATVGTITGLFVNYNGQRFPFTLTVNPKAGNNYPSYPDPGAVKVNKTATGIDFQASGVATVELSASGIPMNEGVDVVIILDTSGSMSSVSKFPDENGTEMYRIELLRPAVNNLIQQLKTKREDGSDPDIDIAIATFNGNTVSTSGNYIGDTGKPQASGTDTSKCGVKTGDGTIAGAWEDINTISSTWATDNNNANTPTSSGTNYDYGLQMAYDLLAQKKADSNTERLQFVLFLSDGAPSQYNGVWANDGVSNYLKWLRGNYDDTDADTSNNIPNTVSETTKTFYTGFNNNNGQLHRSAEAIKAAVGEPKNIIRFNNGVGALEEVEGLGATVYSIGLLLEASAARSEDDQITVLKTIASDESKFFNIDSVNDLKGAFTTFATDVLLAATNARFEDEMGEMYDLQLKPITYKPTGSDEDATINPVLEVRSYEIWTRAEYEADKFSDEDQIGTRKTNADGTYKFETLEVITITSATEATSDQLTDANIIKDGVICGKYVYYNTTDAAVEVDGITVGAESFYWNIGDIKTTELALRYNVYLTNALGENGGRDAGSYATNGEAILYYDNYLGNPCQKEATSPTLAWKGALVNYAFYLVDATTGKPVNNDGIEVPFSNRTVIVNPTFYGNINLNTSEAVESLNIAAESVLPAGYWLYDEDAEYAVAVYGNGSGSWTITGDTTLKNSKSTYVTDYHGSEYINENCDSHEHPDYDFTHTTVWFAVKWEPRAVADTVVIDYGLPVDVHVLTNDMFGKYGKLVGIAKGNVDTAEGDTAQGDFGTAVLDVPETGYTEANSVIRYTLDDMEMKTPDVFTYSVQYANPIVSDNDGFYYGTLTVIPATTIYYEDTFLDLASYTRTDRDAKWESANLWTQETDSDATQDEDRPGEVNFAFNTIIDANNVYGYDSAYKNMAEHSLGNAASVHVDANSYATATFTFWGTGFDVISMTSNTTGTLAVQVFDDENNMVRNTLVDTFYGMDEKGEYAPNDSEAIYQVPVIKISELEYGQYTVKITATYNTLMDHTGTENEDGTQDGYDLYLDAIRIYDPTGNLDETANNAYIEDGEAFPVYEELRNNIIGASEYKVTTNEDGTVTVTGSNEAVKGGIFIDCNDKAVTIADYVSYGPNNELYLANGQAIAFTVDVTETMADIHLGIKAANGGSVTYEINGDTYTVNTATDMYYSIWEYAKNGGVVVVENVQGGILSLTNIKATFTAQTTTNGLLKMTAEDAGVALMMLRKAPEVEDEVPETTAPEETDPEETVPETTAPEETDPEESVPETTDPEESEPEESVPETKPAKPDNSALKAAVEAARKLKEKDYTKESYKAVKAARNVAEKVLKNKRATQAEIDEALADLNEAMDALESKAPAAKPGKDENKNQNQNASNNGNTNKEEQKVNLIGWIIDVLFGWMFD